MKKILYLSFFTCFAAGIASAQQGVNVGTNTPPHSSATLEVSGTSGGFLLPRLTTQQRNNVQNPAIGLEVYNTTTQCIEAYFPSGWKNLGCDCINPPSTPTTITGPAHVCPGSPNVLFVVSPVQGATNYTWTLSNQDVLASGQGNDSIRVNFSNAAGNHTISVMATNSCGNSSAYNFTVNVSNPDSSFTISPPQVITSVPATFTATQPGLTYAWVFPSGSPASSVNQSQAVTWTNAGTYAVQLTVTDNYGCTSQKITNVVVTNCPPPFSFTFSNCSATGRFGPNQSQCNSTYGPGVVTVSNGIQLFTIPYTGNYRITAAGAKGGSSPTSSGSNGAIMRGDFALTAGQVIKILVGQQGVAGSQSQSCAGGGGGTFVTLQNNTPLIVAGGGGGSGGIANSPGQGGTTTTQSTTAIFKHTGTIIPASNSGNGGVSPTSPATASGGGGGLNGNGANSGYNGALSGGISFVNGGNGGEGINSSNSSCGGFGGGGGAHGNTYLGGGGGGGYSGGPGGYTSNAGSFNTDGGGGGGGGGSYNSGTNQVNQAGTSTGHGYVTFQLVCP